MVGAPSKYADIQKPEMRLKYLELLDKSNIFPEDRDILKHYDEQFFHENSRDTGTYKPKIVSYKDLLSTYVNLLEKSNNEDIQNDFSSLLRQICGIQKKSFPYQRNQHLVTRDKPIKIISPVDATDTTLEQKKNRLEASIEAKRKINLEAKLRQRQSKTIEVSDPTDLGKKARMLREEKKREQEQTLMRTASSQRLLNNLGHVPSSRSAVSSKIHQSRCRLETARSSSSGEFDFSKFDPSPIMTRIIEKIKDQMSAENLKKKRNVVDKEPDIGKMKLKDGSVMEHMPTYNDMFNEGKTKVFPL